MKKRTNIVLDTALVSAASATLGTLTTTETVHAAMAEVVRRERLRRLTDRDFGDLTPAELAGMRAPRLPAS